MQCPQSGGCSGSGRGVTLRLRPPLVGRRRGRGRAKRRRLLRSLMTFQMTKPFSTQATVSLPPVSGPGTAPLLQDHAPPAQHHRTPLSPSAAQGRGQGEKPTPPSHPLSLKVRVCGTMAVCAVRATDYLPADEFSKDSFGPQLSGMGSPDVSASPGDESVAMAMQQTGKKKASHTHVCHQKVAWSSPTPLPPFLPPGVPARVSQPHTKGGSATRATRG